MTSASDTIAIAGAGIGGLAAALALSQRGFQSHVFERRSDDFEVGAGIQLGPNATGVLAHLGVLDAVRSVAAAPDAVCVHDAHTGRVLSRLPLGTWMRERHGAPYLTLHRHDLHQALLRAAQTDPRIGITTGREVVGFGQRTDVLDIEFGDGSSSAAAALVAADGLWSKLRTKVATCTGPSPAGKSAYRTVVPRDVLAKELAANDVHVWLSPGAHVVHYPVRNGLETAIVVIIDGAVVQDGWNSDASVATLKASPIAHFAGSVRDMLCAAPAWRVWALQSLAPLPRWTTGNVTLMGDAAHPLLPFFAQGGGLALEDAAVLAQCVARTGPMSERLKAFESNRLARTSRVAKASADNGRIYHLGGPAAVARNAVLTTVPASLMMRRYDWLYGWKPPSGE